MSKKRQPTRWPNVVRYPDGTYYAFIKPLHGGDSKEISLRTKKAMVVPDALKIADLKVQRSGYAGSRLKYKDVIEEYLDDKKKDWKPRTYYENKQLANGHLLKFFGQMKLNDIDHNQWELFVKKKVVSDYMNQRYVLTNFLKWAAYKNWIQPQPLVFKLPKHKRRSRRILKPNEICSCLKVIGGKFELFIHFILFHGMRENEVTHLIDDDINFEFKAVIIRDSKTNKGRVVPLLDFTGDLVKSYRKKLEGKCLFPHRDSANKPATQGWFRKSFAKMLRDAKLSDITPHDFRATSEKYASKLKKFTDIQREKMFGSSVEVQNEIYITEFHVEELRGLESAMFDKEKGVKGLEKIIQSKALDLEKTWEKKSDNAGLH